MSAPASAAATPIAPSPGRGFLGDRRWRRFRRHTLALVGLAIIATIVLLALLAPVVAPVDPNRIDLGRQRRAPVESPARHRQVWP